MKIEISFKAGSKFQEDFAFKLFRNFLTVTQRFLHSNHKNNILEYKLTKKNYKLTALK